MLKLNKRSPQVLTCSLRREILFNGNWKPAASITQTLSLVIPWQHAVAREKRVFPDQLAGCCWQSLGTWCFYFEGDWSPFLVSWTLRSTYMDILVNLDFCVFWPFNINAVILFVGF